MGKASRCIVEDSRRIEGTITAEVLLQYDHVILMLTPIYGIYLIKSIPCDIWCLNEDQIIQALLPLHRLILSGAFVDGGLVKHTGQYAQFYDRA